MSDSNSEMEQVANGDASENSDAEKSDSNIQNGNQEEDSDEEADSESEDEVNGKERVVVNGVDRDSESSEEEDGQEEPEHAVDEEGEEDEVEDEDMSSMSEAEAGEPRRKKPPLNTSGSSVENIGGSPRKRGRPSRKSPLQKKTSSRAARSSPEKKTRGRPKKLQSKDIEMQLDEEDEEEEGDGEDDSEEEESSSSPVNNKRRKVEEAGRRSGRERKVPKKFEMEVPKKKSRKKKKVMSESESENDDDDSDSEYDTKRKKKATKKKLDKFNIYKKSPVKVKRKKREVKKKKGSDSEGSEDESGGEGAEVIRQYKSQKKNWSLEEKKSNRLVVKKKYAEEDETHSSDVRSDFDPLDVVVVEQEDIEGIAFVLDHRTGKVGATGERTMFWSVKNEGDPNESLETEETEEQFLIKWSGWSHLNNTWESEESLKAKKKGEREVKGIRKLVNYQLKLSDFKAWKRRANAEDIEYQEIDIEMGRQLLATYVQVERIFAQRKNDTGGLDYYVKWTNLPYSEATWEDESVINSYYSLDLETFTTRRKAKTNPRNYNEAMKANKKKFVALKEQPEYLGSETLRLRDYQMDGVNFMLKAWAKGHSTILADEMGLGKTIQSISFLKYLFHNFAFKGPMLVCVPLSTMAAWQKEFSQWAPDMNMVAYIGDGKSRDVIRKFECENADGELTFNVLLTNYEMVCKDAAFFQDIAWSNIVVDEAHRLKNDQSLLFKVLVGIESHHRLLLTGTPLQNSLKELWCLLKYLQLPDIDMSGWEIFEAEYGTAEDRATGYVKLHSLLKPFIIRRMKKDVEKSLPPKVEQILRVEMTQRQKKFYKLVLTKNYDALSKGKNQVSLLNIMMQLRKTCNHLELIADMAEEELERDPPARLHQLIYGSGKLLLLDKLLTRFRENGDRVLIFSQMVIMLNILEEFLTLRRFPHQRLDGGVSNDKRKQSIAQFNDPNSRDFCFLLSTKAGGLGINLQTANRVVIFDSDWNPQNDLQAIARAHRIGQKEEVKIFRFVASSSVDEDIIHKAKNKMVLDHLVIQSMDTTGKTVISGGGGDNKKSATPFNKTELNMILKFGAEDLFKTEDTEEEKELDLDTILQSAETREDEEAPQSEANKELLGAFKCTNIAFDEEELEEEKDVAAKGWGDIIPAAMVEEHRVKTGIEAYSDPEELYNPIAMRRKKRVKKKFDRFATEDSAPNSAVGSREGSDAEEGEASGDSDMTDGEREMMKELKKRNAENGGRQGGPKKNYAKKSVICLQCKKCFVERKGLKKHMREVHRAQGWTFSAANILDAFPVNTDSPADSGAEALMPGGLDHDHEGLSPKKKRGPPQGNTRCFPCGKSFQHRLGYKTHIKVRHEGVEPPDNLDPANLAKPDERISCLICQKKFTAVLGLKGHIQRVHLGLAAPAEEGEKQNGTENEEGDKQNEEEGGEKQNGDAEGGTQNGDAEGGTQNGAVEGEKQNGGETEEVKEEAAEEKKEMKQGVSQEDASLIEKMYYMMRRYGCQYCTARFNNKGKLAMHESIHAKDKKPVICPHCEKSYSRRDKLRKHIERIHPGKPMPEHTGLSPPEKPRGPELAMVAADVAYQRVAVKLNIPGGEEGEGEMTGELAALLARVRQVIGPDGVAKIQCPDCEATFSFQKGCVRHIKMFHVTERKVQCKLCPMTYADKKGLYQHMHRKHPKNRDTPEPSGEESDASSQGSQPSLASSEGAATHACKLCPRAYANAGSLWAHKKAKHPDSLTIPSSPLVANGQGMVTPTVPRRDFNCPMCPKIYGNYMSLYMHKKTKHPNGASPGGAASMGNSPITPRREKNNQCPLCPKRYADLKGVAAHMEKIHPGHQMFSPPNVRPPLGDIRLPAGTTLQPLMLSPPPQVLSPPMERDPLAMDTLAVSPRDKVPLDCPYCTSCYSRRDKLNEHIRKCHPDMEVPRAVRSPNKSGGDGGGEVQVLSHLGPVLAVSPAAASLAPIFLAANNGFLPSSGREPRGKYKPKQYACPACGKRYSDASRLQNHVEQMHMQDSSAPWPEVGPGADVAVRNLHHPSGFEVYKVVSVFADGARMKCARFAPVEANKWVLTEEVNKSVMKADILRSLALTKQPDSGVFSMEQEQLEQLERALGGGGANGKEVSEDEAGDDDDDEVMVEPVFEEGVSDSGEAMETGQEVE